MAECIGHEYCFSKIISPRNIRRWQRNVCLARATEMSRTIRAQRFHNKNHRERVYGFGNKFQILVVRGLVVHIILAAFGQRTITLSSSCFDSAHFFYCFVFCRNISISWFSCFFVPQFMSFFSAIHIAPYLRWASSLRHTIEAKAKWNKCHMHHINGRFVCPHFVHTYLYYSYMHIVELYSFFYFNFASLVSSSDRCS